METIISIHNTFLTIINRLIIVCIGLAVIGFFWGIIKVLFNKDSAIAKAEGRSYMLYGVILLFVMTSLWGLVYMLQDTFSL